MRKDTASSFVRQDQIGFPGSGTQLSIPNGNEPGSAVEFRYLPRVAHRFSNLEGLDQVTMCFIKAQKNVRGGTTQRMPKDDVEILLFSLVNVGYDAFPSNFDGSEVSELVQFLFVVERTRRAKEGVESAIRHLISARDDLLAAAMAIPYVCVDQDAYDDHQGQKPF